MTVLAHGALGDRRWLAVRTGYVCAADHLLEAAIAAYGDQVFVAGAASLTTAHTVPQPAIAVHIARGQRASAQVIDGAALVDAVGKELRSGWACPAVSTAALQFVGVGAIVSDEIVRAGVSFQARCATGSAT